MPCPDHLVARSLTKLQAQLQGTYDERPKLSLQHNLCQIKTGLQKHPYSGALFKRGEAHPVSLHRK